MLGARVLGVEGAARWRSPGGWGFVEANASWQDARNVSTEGALADYRGDRLPNLPWLLVNVQARAQRSSLLSRGDRLALTYRFRYVHGFHRDWESLGAPQYRQSVDAQQVHSLGLFYTLAGRVPTTLAIDVENLGPTTAYGVVAKAP